ncbi:MAG: signal peptide peptidase SppA [Flammeovirgaceae bacterium]|nr:signal peptide peptidase SppA [Flammeovirgaceae bacterium]|tara:strand:+ start:12115 stop:13884 length:1770 start_codon:yes stop_codon:yes gene_type:complete
MNFIKEILKSTIKGIISFFLGLLIIIITFSFLSALFSGEQEEVIYIEENSLLHIDNLSIIGDRDTKPSDLNFNLNDIPLPLPLIDNSDLEQKISLQTFKRVIESAKNDDKIKGIFLNVENASLSFNKVEKVRSILEDFKKDKPIYSFSNIQSKASYYISSISNFNAISPPGFISVSGFGIGTFFYKSLFDEIGINIELFRAGEFKGAAEPFVRNNFSKENKKQYMNLLDYRMENYLGNISESRNIKEDVLIDMIDKYQTELSSDAYENNLIDSIMYEDQMTDYLKSKVDSSYKKIKLIKYLNSLEKVNKYNKNKIAILYLVGDVLPGYGDEGIFSETIIDNIKKIKKNKNIKSVILYFNSGGGSAYASDLITREIELLQKEKPVITYMSDVCASAAYYMSMPTDTLIASEGSVVGSIGVFAIFPDLSELISEKIKIKSDYIKTNENIGEIDLAKPLSNSEKNLIQRGVNYFYDDFLDVVSRGRNMTTEEVDLLARGKVYYGQESKDLNLVDVIGSLEDAIKIASDLGEVEKYQIVEYPKQKTDIEKIISSLEMSTSITEIDQIDNWLVKSLLSGEKFDPYQMRLEFKFD